MAFALVCPSAQSLSGDNMLNVVRFVASRMSTEAGRDLYHCSHCFGYDVEAQAFEFSVIFCSRGDDVTCRQSGFPGRKQMKLSFIRQTGLFAASPSRWCFHNGPTDIEELEVLMKEGTIVACTCLFLRPWNILSLVQSTTFL